MKTASVLILAVFTVGIAMVVVIAALVWILVADWWRDRADRFEETTADDILEGVAIMRDGTDWQTERVEALVAKEIGRHRIGVAPGSAAQQARWTQPTGAFDLVTSAVFDTTEMAGLADLIDTWKCLHCEGGEHHDCVGCTCPCSMAEVSS